MKKPHKPNLGQHFLTSEKALRQIVDAAELTENDTVLEIGPGKGVLTKTLLQKAAHVIAVEKDTTLVALLEETFSHEIKDGKLTIIPGDIRSFDPKEYGLEARKYKLVANIPYYITGELLRTFLEQRVQPERIVFLMQKEVAERIARSKKESILSISVKIYGNPRYIATVPRGAFSPPPDVDSAILCIEGISRDCFDTFSEDFFFTLVKTAFSQKRKMLKSNLATIIPQNKLEEALQAADVSPQARAEDIPLTQWVVLARELSNEKSRP